MTARGSVPPRIDSKDKVTGDAIYAADLQREGMLYARVLRSPHPHARILSIDATEASRLPGVEIVLTAKDIPGVKVVGPVVRDQPILAEDKVHQVGAPVAIVAAVSEEIAQQALSLIKVDYQPLEPLFDPLLALKEDAPKVHETGNLSAWRRVIRGDIAKGFQEAEVIVENTYTTPFVEHAYLEPESGLAYMEDGRIILRVPTQAPHGDQMWASRVLGINPDMIRVIATEAGGSFGGKTTSCSVPMYTALALLCYKLKRPVKFSYSRQESFMSTSKRHPFHMKVRTGATKDGRLTALQMEIVSNTGAYASTGPFVLVKAVVLATGPYYFPHVLIEGKSVYTNSPHCGSFRGFGVPQVALAMESQMDILAERLGIDPLEFRLKNAFEPGSMTSTGQTLGESVGIKRTIEAVRSYYEEAKRSLTSTKQRNSHLKRGLGVACMWSGIGPEEAHDPSECFLEIDLKGKLKLFTGAADVGQGTRNVLATIAARVLDTSVDNFEVISADTDLTPNCSPGVASKQTYLSGNAVLQAAQRLKASLLQTAAKVLEERIEDLDLKDGHLVSRKDPSLHVSLPQLAAYCLEAGTPMRTTGRYDYPLLKLDPETGQGILYQFFIYATHIVEVEVNTETGETRAIRVVAAQDVGHAIHPPSVISQMTGGVVMAMGFALKEDFVADRSEGFLDYPIDTRSSLKRT